MTKKIFHASIFDARLRESGGTVLKGIRIPAENNNRLIKLTKDTGLTRTKIINNAIEIKSKLYPVELNDEFINLLKDIYNKNESLFLCNDLFDVLLRLYKKQKSLQSLITQLNLIQKIESN